MAEPEKPFACTVADCGMTFTNEDHLHVHTKKHDMVLTFGLEQKTAFVADQTPTPTRFIRNCEEVGLFQDLQNVNPFDEGFKRAMETKSGILSIENAIATSSSDDVLHTPQVVFPHLDAGDSALFSTTNNQRNITISRSSSDESGAVKEYETTTISKLTNEVTTISRVVGKQDMHDKTSVTDDVITLKHDDLSQNKDVVNERSVSYTNNVIKIHSNVEIRKDGGLVNIDSSKNLPVTLISYTDSVRKDATSVVTKDVLLADPNRLQVPDLKVPPIMSQRSLDYVVDSLVADTYHNEQIQEKEKDNELIKMMKRNFQNVLNRKSDEAKRNEINKVHGERIKRNVKIKSETDNRNNDYEVIIKLPNGKCVRMTAEEEVADVEDNKPIKNDTKEKLKRVLSEKVDKKASPPVLQRPPSLNDVKFIQNVIPTIPAVGTLYPVAIVNPVNASILLTNTLQKVPIAPLSTTINKKPVKRKVQNDNEESVGKKTPSAKENKDNIDSGHEKESVSNVKVNSTKVSYKVKNGCHKSKSVPRTSSKPSDDIDRRNEASRRYRRKHKEIVCKLYEENNMLKSENNQLKHILNEHLKKCPAADDLRTAQNLLQQVFKH